MRRERGLVAEEGEKIKGQKGKGREGEKGRLH